jgi:hypothetical protein
MLLKKKLNFSRMFDKKAYRERRKGNKRGQGDAPTPVFHPKGEEVERIKDGEKVPVLNADGGHVVRTSKGFERVNRKIARAKQKIRHASKPNVKYHKFKHIVKAVDKHRRHFHFNRKPEYDPASTNHQRHKARQEARNGK